MTIFCNDCGLDKPDDQFYKRTSCKGRLKNPYCKPCWATRCRDYYKKNPDAYWARLMFRKYGVTVAQYESMLAAQDGHCATCPATTPGSRSMHFQVDHDHRTGVVRGLLCLRCNLAIGQSDDNVSVIEAWAQYLRGTLGFS